jgi:hypothetical protein
MQFYRKIHIPSGIFRLFHMQKTRKFFGSWFCCPAVMQGPPASRTVTRLKASTILLEKKHSASPTSCTRIRYTHPDAAFSEHINHLGLDFEGKKILILLFSLSLLPEQSEYRVERHNNTYISGLFWFLKNQHHDHCGLGLL